MSEKGKEAVGQIDQGEPQKPQGQPVQEGLPGSLVASPGDGCDQSPQKDRYANGDFVKAMTFKTQGGVLESLQIDDAQQRTQREKSQQQALIASGE